ncbi:MAG: carbohydrate binding domain-containing protein [Elusimicrobia bacterium]|nr:carbohydrate binding domain-containing protein [Elusimicrobiota bacterium]
MKNHSLLKRIGLRSGLSVLALAGAMGLHAQTRDWQTLFRSTDNALNGGQGYTSDPNGAVLAWNEGPLLKSYLQMFEAYHEPYYLRKLVTHFDQTTVHLRDWNGDGGRAWGTSNYTDELLANPAFSGAGPAPGVLTVNPGFEDVDPQAPTLPAGWTRSGSSTEVFRSTNLDDRYQGSAGLVVKTNGVNWRHGIQNLTYVPGAVYHVSVWGKTNGKVKGRIGIYDRTEGTVVLGEKFFDSTVWQKVEFNVQAPSVPGRDVKIYCYTDQYLPTDGVVYFDEVEWIGVGDPVAVNQNPGFEVGEGGVSANLPAGWTRSGTSEEVYRSLLAEDRRAGSAGLVVKTNGSSWRHGIQSLRNVYLPGQSYYVSFWGKTNGKVKGRVGVYDRTSGTVTLAEVFFSNSNWAFGSLTFTAPPAAGNDLQILCYFDDYKPTDGRVSFDDVRVALADSAHAADWRAVGGLPSTVNRTKRTDCPSRPYCLEVRADGDGTAPAAEQESFRAVPGAIYQVRVKSWGSARLEILNGESVIEFAERTSDSWGDLDFFFTAPVAGNNPLKMRLTLTRNALGTTARFDQASLKMQAEYLVHQAVLLAPILRFARLVREDPWLQPEFNEKAESYIVLAKETILPSWERDWREKGDQGFYVSNDQKDFGRAGETADIALPHNQYLPMAEIFLDLWHLTGQTKYREKAEKLGKSFKAFLKPVTLSSGGGYVWHYADNLFQDGFDSGLKAEDLNHGNLDISAVLRMAEDSVVFSPEDMRMFARTLLETVWNGNIIDPFMHSRVDGSDIVGHEVDYKYGMNEWVGLARYDPAVWPLVDRLFTGISWRNGVRLLTVSGLAKFDPLQKPIERTAPGNVTATALSSTTVRLSWTPPAGPTMNANPGFEASNVSDLSLPDGWTRSGTSTQVFRSTALNDRRFGNAGLVVKTDGTRWFNGIRGLTYTPGETYLVTFWGKTNGRVRGRVGVYDRTGGVTVVLKDYFFSNSEWAPMSFRFTAPNGSGKDLKLYCYFDDYRITDGVVWFDEIRVSKDMLAPATYKVYQAGVEKASTAESTLLLRELTAKTTYLFTVVARDSEGNQSPQSFEAMVRTMPPSVGIPLPPILPGDPSAWETVDTARAYPSPFQSGRGADGITFDRIPAETTVRIYTLDGHPVKTLISTTGGAVLWDLTNDEGNPVASGVYLAIMEKNGGTKRLKVVVQK